MTRPWDTESLPDLLEHIWMELARIDGDRDHPWRLPVLATSGSHGANARTVVLRGVTRPGHELMAFSDRRALKVSELRHHCSAVWVFYDPNERVQLRAFTEVRVHVEDTVVDTYWHRLPEANRSNYLSEKAPGAGLEAPGAGRVLSPGSAHQFAVLIGRIERLDWLWLREGGHRRAGFQREGAGWSGSWLEP